MTGSEDNLDATRRKLTLSGKAFFEEDSQTMGLFGFVCATALSIDRTSSVAKAALDGEDVREMDLSKLEPGKATKQLRQYRQELLEMILARAVDNFTNYLSSVVREALFARPEVLRSEGTVRLDYVLGFDCLEDFREDLVDRKVNDLGYLGLASLDDWIKAKMNLSILGDKNAASSLAEIIETRNLVVHARGLVGSKYLKNVPDSKFEAGDRRTLDVDYLLSASNTLHDAVRRFDSAIADKFGLDRVTVTLSDSHLD